MKNIKVLIAFLLLSCSVLGQESGRNVPAEDVATFSPPTGSKKSPVESLKSSKKPGKNSELDFHSFKNFNGSILDLEESRWILTGAIGSLTSTFLEDQKKGLDHLQKASFSNDNYTSEIKSFNNYRVLLTKYDGTDFSYTRFTAVNDRLDSAIGGVIEYEKKDKIDVDKMLEGFFKGLQFKSKK